MIFGYFYITWPRWDICETIISNSITNSSKKILLLKFYEFQRAFVREVITILYTANLKYLIALVRIFHLDISIKSFLTLLDKQKILNTISSSSSNFHLVNPHCSQFWNTSCLSISYPSYSNGSNNSKPLNTLTSFNSPYYSRPRSDDTPNQANLQSTTYTWIIETGAIIQAHLHSTVGTTDFNGRQCVFRPGLVRESGSDCL